jgi:predicted transcriptional regulator
MTIAEANLTKLAVDIVSAYVTNNAITDEKLPDFIGSIRAALGKASTQSVEPEEVELKPAVPVKKSVTPDYIVCLEDGLKFKSLKRHLQSHYNLTPDEYRKKWGLSHDYPMVSPAYAAARSDLARTMGLGRRSSAASVAASVVPKSGAKKSKSAAKASRK